MKTKKKWEGHFVVGENMISSVLERKKIEILKWWEGKIKIRNGESELQVSMYRKLFEITNAHNSPSGEEMQSLNNLKKHLQLKMTKQK